MKKLRMLQVLMVLTIAPVTNAKSRSLGSKEFGSNSSKKFASINESATNKSKASLNKKTKNEVEWKRSLKFAKNAERMLKYYTRKKNPNKMKLYTLKIQGYKLRAKGYKVGSQAMIDSAEKYLLKGQPLPKAKVVKKLKASSSKKASRSSYTYTKKSRSMYSKWNDSNKSNKSSSKNAGVCRTCKGSGKIGGAFIAAPCPGCRKGRLNAERMNRRSY